MADLSDLFTKTSSVLRDELVSHLKDEKTEYLFYKGSLCEEEIKDANVKNAQVFKVGEHRNYLYMNNEEI